MALRILNTGRAQAGTRRQQYEHCAIAQAQAYREGVQLSAIRLYDAAGERIPSSTPPTRTG